MSEKKRARGGLAAQAMSDKSSKPKGKSRPAKAAKVKAPKSKKTDSTDAKSPKRKDRIRELYDSTPPLKKSEIVAILVSEGFGDADKLKFAVANEASYYKNDGGNPKWAPEDKAA